MNPNWVKMPCGHSKCGAVIRMYWPERWMRIEDIAKMVGSGRGTVHRFVDKVGLPPRGISHAKRATSTAAVRRAWLDTSMHLKEAAASVGLSTRGLWSRARALGLGKRPRAPKRTDVVTWPADFAALWLMGCSVKDIAAACDRPPASLSNISKYARSRGLPRRTCGPQKRKISVEEARRIVATEKLAQAMAKTAEAERLVWRQTYYSGEGKADAAA